jgi:hypothetical protein
MIFPLIAPYRLFEIKLEKNFMALGNYVQGTSSFVSPAPAKALWTLGWKYLKLSECLIGLNTIKFLKFRNTKGGYPWETGFGDI